VQQRMAMHVTEKARVCANNVRMHNRIPYYDATPH
jgi:hypothetical protein